MLRGFLDDDGYLPDALFNFLALIGWSPGGDTEIMRREEIVERFAIDGISPSPGIFDASKLDWMNGVYIRMLTPEELAARTRPFLERAGLLPAEATPEERTYAASAIALEQEKLKTLGDAPKLIDFFFTDLPEYADKSVAKWIRKEGVAAYLADLADALAGLPAWDSTVIEASTRSVAERHGREKGEMVHPVRVAVTGREVGPGLYETMQVLGRVRTDVRLRHSVEMARG
jgi:glutamyl-tRNA synthetase